MHIDELNLSPRTFNCLARSGIWTVEQLANMSDDDILRIRTLGACSLREIREKMERLENRQIENFRLNTGNLCDHNTYLTSIQNGGSLLSVPAAHRTHDVYLAAVQQSGTCLGFVPKELRTYDVCLAAVKQDAEALKYVPEELISCEMYLSVVEQKGIALKYVPEELRTSDICFAAVKQDAMALEFVPEAQRTPDICRVAVEQTLYALAYVPNEHLLYSRELREALTTIDTNAFLHSFYMKNSHIAMAILNLLHAVVNLQPVPKETLDRKQV